MRNVISRVALCGLVFTAEVKSQECVKIAALSVAAAVAYGFVNDMVSARVSPEYFSAGFHKAMRDCWDGPILGRCKAILEQTKSPTVVAAIWGIVASWWMGIILSFPVMLSARLGWGCKIAAFQLILPTVVALVVMGFASLVAGVKGYRWAKQTSVSASVEKEDWSSYAAHGCFIDQVKQAQDRQRRAQEAFGKGYAELASEERLRIDMETDWRQYVNEPELDRYIAAGKAHQMAYLAGTLAALGLSAFAIFKRLQGC